MYISKANQILAESQKFYIGEVDPESDLDLICVEDNGDLEDFTVIQSTPEKEQGDTIRKLQLKLLSSSSLIDCPTTSVVILIF